MWRWVYLGHAALVVLLTVAFLALTADTGAEDGANIGVALSPCRC